MDKRIAILVLATVVACFLAGCKGDNVDPNNPPVKKGTWGRPPASMTGGNNPGAGRAVPPPADNTK